MIRPTRFLAIVVKNLARRKVRTAFAIAGVSIGVSMVVAMVSAARGFQTQFEQIVSGYSPDLIVQMKNALIPITSRIRGADADAIERDPDVRSVVRVVVVALQVGDRRFVAFGMRSSEIEQERIGLYDGRLAAAPDEIALGKTAAEQLGVALGDEIELADRRFRVVGFYEWGVGFLDAGGILPLDQAQTLFNFDDALSFLLVYLHPGRSPGPVAERVAAGSSNLKAIEPGNFVNEFQQFEMIQDFAWIISALSILGGGIVVVNTMIMGVYERTREIGLLLAIGWSRLRVVGLVVAEGVVICLVSGVIGIGLGWLELELAGRYIQDGWLAFDLTPSFLGLVVVISVALGVGSSLYPGIRAASMHPVEALRYE